MKKNSHYIAWAALAMGLAACTADEGILVPASDEVVQIRTLIATEVQSRVNTEGDGTSFSNGDVITLKNTSRDTKNQGSYAYDGQNWSPTGDTYVLWQGKENNDFQAWYPATAAYTTFTIPTDQSSTNLSAADWMTAIGTAKREDGCVDLAFAHLLSKVTVTISSYGTEYGEAAKDISDFRIYTSATEMTATYEGGTTVMGTAAGTAITPYEGTDSYVAVVAPGAYSGTFLTLNVKVGEGEAKAMTVAAPAGLTLESGKAYAFNLKVGKDKAELGTVSVTPWNEENNSLGNIQATEVKVTVTTNGSTATITIPELATDAMLQKAMQEFDAEGITTVVVNSPLTETQQGIIATALADETISLYLPQMETSELIDDLVSTEDNISVYCGYYVDNGTYIVYNAEGLKAWRSYASSNLSTNLTLAADITLTASDVWSPIGANSNSSYTGAIEGNGHTIYNMTINPGSNNLAGMMGYMKGGSIKNLYLANVNVTSNNAHCGSFAGNIAGTLIENSGVKSGTIRQTSTSFQSFAGGIVGQSVGGTIVACYNAASIVNRYTSGGIVGYHDSSELNIIGCYNIGSVQVTGESRAYTAGGILGNFNSTTHYIKGCYNTGSVTSAQYDGQIPGAIGGKYSSSYTQSAYNYYSSDHSYGFGQTNGSTSNAGCTQISNTASEWEAAATEMNKALESYGYRYVANADESTQSTQPLVIEKIYS